MALEPMCSRGVSEGVGVGVLVVLTVLATVSVGMTVTLVMDDEKSGAQFTFDHSGDLEQLLIFYDEGDELRAGSIHISGASNEVTWAEIEEMEPDEMVAPSNIPARLTDDNAWGSSVSEDEFIEIRYVPEGEDDEEVEETVLATWNDPTEQEDDGIVEPPEP